LTPGIHINLVSAYLVFLSAGLLAQVPPIYLAIFIVSMSITHIFIDYIPSIFLGAPDDSNFLSILPGHEMLIKGQAYSAVIYTLYGSLIGLGLLLILFPLFLVLLPLIYPYAQRIMFFIILVTIFFLLYFEKDRRGWAIFIFILSGLLGIGVYNLPLRETLLPMFTGLFGISSLITSAIKRQKLPEQKILKLKQIPLEKKSIVKTIYASLLASPLCGFLPGLGSGQAAVIGSQIIQDIDRKEFLVLLGSVNTLVLSLSFITLYSINKFRTGVAAAISKIITISFNDLLILFGVIIVSGLISFFISIYLARFFSRIISRINYQILSIVIMIILIIFVCIFSGWLGLLVAFVSSMLGLTSILLGIRRTHLMGCLLIPTLLFYL